MPEISRQQKQYLARQKKEKHIILAARTLLFVLFMGLWEISSDLGWIDSFIFSSPSLIAETFLSMCRDQSLFAHIAVTLAENSCQFLFFVVILGVGTTVLLWCSRRIARILEPCLVVLNSLPKSALAPHSDRMAWCQRTYHCGRRHVCSHLRVPLSICTPASARQIRKS